MYPLLLLLTCKMKHQHPPIMHAASKGSPQNRIPHKFPVTQRSYWLVPVKTVYGAGCISQYRGSGLKPLNLASLHPSIQKICSSHLNFSTLGQRWATRGNRRSSRGRGGPDMSAACTWEALSSRRAAARNSRASRQPQMISGVSTTYFTRLASAADTWREVNRSSHEQWAGSHVHGCAELDALLTLWAEQCMNGSWRMVMGVFLWHA